MKYNFEWDPHKARLNLGKHKIPFEEAATVFHDPKAVTVFDPDHSGEEDRWITMGISKTGRLLIVCHTFRKEGEESATVRIYSCRKSTRHEKEQYGELK